MNKIIYVLMAVVLVALSVFAFVGCADVANAVEPTVDTFVTSVPRVVLGCQIRLSSSVYVNHFEIADITFSRTGSDMTFYIGGWSAGVNNVSTAVNSWVYGQSFGLSCVTGAYGDTSTTGFVNLYGAYQAYRVYISDGFWDFISANPLARPLYTSCYVVEGEEDVVFPTGVTFNSVCYIMCRLQYADNQYYQVGFPSLTSNLGTSTTFFSDNPDSVLDNAYRQGYEEARSTVDKDSESYKSGYDTAKSEWYAKGFAVGEKESQTWFGYLAGVAQAPIEFLKESLSFELLGVSMYDFVCSILMVCALLVVVKAVSGV